MSKTILIELKAKDNASKVLEKTEKNVEDFGNGVKTAGGGITNVTKTAHMNLNKLGNEFRFMTIAFGAMAAGSIGLVKGFVNSAKEMEAATLRIGVFAASTGQSIEGAQQLALDFASTGLVSVTEASNTLSNLLATGLNLDTAQKLMQGMLDTAVLSKESLTDTYGRALEKSSLGIRILQERQVDAIGINFTAIQVWKEYGDTIGKTTNEMSTQEKQMAIVNHLLNETKRFAGGADLAMQTFGGTLSRLSTVTEIMKAKLGATLIPLIGSLADAISSLSKKITILAEKFPALISILIVGGTVFITVIAALAALGAIVPLVSKAFTSALIPAFVAVGKAGAVSFIQFTAIALAIGAISYLVLKVTGLWDKWRNSVGNLQQKIKDSIKEFTDFGNDSTEALEKVKKEIADLNEQMSISTRDFRESLATWVKKNTDSTVKIVKDIDELKRKYKEAIDEINEDFTRSNEDATISHQRKVEDITRQIEEEVSKGIWADQTKIRDLERSLKRENEDYARQNQQRQSDRKKDLSDEEISQNESLSKLQEELDKELAMRVKHAEDIASVLDVVLLDEVDKMKRSYEEKMNDLNKKMGELEKSAEDLGGSMGDAFGDGVTGADGLNQTIEHGIKKINELKMGVLEAEIRISESSLTITSFFKGISDAIVKDTEDYGKFVSDMVLSIGVITATAGAILGIVTAIKAVIAWYTGMKLAIGVLTLYTGSSAAIMTLAFLPLWAILLTISAVLFTIYGVIQSIRSVVAFNKETEALNESLNEGNKLYDRRLKYLKKEREEGRLSSKQYQEKLRQLQEMSKNTGRGEVSTGGFHGVELPFFQEGGVIPGSPSTPVPIIAHGGETVLPAGVQPVTININNPTVRSDSDISRIAEQVKAVLSRGQFLRQFK